jgi:site-specific DNA-cytosine methylase
MEVNSNLTHKSMVGRPKIWVQVRTYPVVSPSFSKRHYDRINWAEKTGMDPGHRPSDIHRPTKTIQKDFHAGSQMRHVIDFPSRRIHKLTWQEMAKAQGIPESLFPKTMREKDVINLIGNSIPPPMTEAFIKSLLKVIDLKKETYIEICAGIGNLSHSVEKIGLKPLALIEMEPTACEVLRSRFDPTKVVCGDLFDFNYRQHANSVGLLCGGPPCQPYSSAGSKQGMNDIRDVLGDTPQIVGLLKPEVFMFENVSGLLRGAMQTQFESILNNLRRQGYTVNYHVSDAVNFGLPQYRCRVFIIGLRGNRRESEIDSIFEKVEKMAKWGKTSKWPAKTIDKVIEPDATWMYWPYGNPYE